MKIIVLAVMFSLLTLQVYASEIIPSRLIVKELIEAVHDQKNEVIGWYFKFDKKIHVKITSLSRDEQLQLLKDLSLEKLKFDKDEYAEDMGKRFVVRLLAPKRIDFEIEKVIYHKGGSKGPPWGYQVIAIRKTAKPIN